MANVAITPSAVLRSGTTGTDDGLAGEAIDAGEWLYRDTDGSLKLADCTSLAKSKVVGIAINSAATGQPIRYATPGDVTVDNLVIATVYVLSATAGKMCPSADLVSGNYLTVLGAAKSSTQFRQSVTITEAQVA